MPWRGNTWVSRYGITPALREAARSGRRLVVHLHWRDMESEEVEYPDRAPNPTYYSDGSASLALFRRGGINPGELAALQGRMSSREFANRLTLDPPPEPNSGMVFAPEVTEARGFQFWRIELI